MTPWKRRTKRKDSAKALRREGPESTWRDSEEPVVGRMRRAARDRPGPWADTASCPRAGESRGSPFSNAGGDPVCVKEILAAWRRSQKGRGVTSEVAWTWMVAAERRGQI